MLNVVDEYTHERLSIRASRRLKAADVIDVLSGLFIVRGLPEHIRSDDGPEFIAATVQRSTRAVGAKTAHSMPSSPRENGSVESTDACVRDEICEGEIFQLLWKAEVSIES